MQKAMLSVASRAGVFMNQFHNAYTCPYNVSCAFRTEINVTIILFG